MDGWYCTKETCWKYRSRLTHSEEGKNDIIPFFLWFYRGRIQFAPEIKQFFSSSLSLFFGPGNIVCEIHTKEKSKHAHMIYTKLYMLAAYGDGSVDHMRRDWQATRLQWFVDVIQNRPNIVQLNCTNRLTPINVIIGFSFGKIGCRCDWPSLSMLQNKWFCSLPYQLLMITWAV